MLYCSAAEALTEVRSGDRVYLHGGAATPGVLVEALVSRADELRGVEICHLHTEIPAPYVDPGLSESFRHNALFIGPNTRQAVAEGRADYTPVFLSEIPDLFAPGGELPLDVALIQVAPPDANGECSLGVSVDVALAGAKYARLVIAQVNPLMPRTFGASIPASQIDLAVLAEAPLPGHAPGEPSATAQAIAAHITPLIADGSTLQAGIGEIPNAVLGSLRSHRNLGIHTEMFSDGAVDLIETGVINGAKKSMHPGRAVTAFVVGSDRLYAFVDGNPAVEFQPVTYTNNVDVIGAQYQMVAINSALSVDLTGQVSADSIGTRFYSGIGGQVDFIRGAARSKGGLPIIALPSTASGGTISRITPTLLPGSGVVTTRGDVHWVITEYGAVNLHGRTIRQRARMLIDIAHPDYRAALEEEAGKLGFLRPE